MSASPVTVVAALIWRQGKVLICQRAASGDFPGKWEFPGGKVQDGEDPRAALQRELSEELGIRAEPAALVERVEHQYPGRAAVLLLFFSVGKFCGDPQNRVFQQILWVEPGELPHFDFLEADLELVWRLAAGKLLPAG